MRNAAVFFICLTVIGFFTTSPGRAYSSLTQSTFEQQRAPIVAITHHYDDIYDGDDFDDAPPPRRPDPSPPPPDTIPALEFLPPAPPANCGEFRYWNGEYCADARVEPPYTGPRW